MAKEKLPIEGDDGRTIAPMNVEGMPWYRKDRPEPAAKSAAQPKEKLSPAERWAFFTGILKACLLITVCIWGVIALFILVIFLFGK